jgi:hypothetical protein
MRTESLVDVSPDTPWWTDDTVLPADRDLEAWRSIVLDAFGHLRTLTLTHRQGQRLWGMDEPTCRAVLDGLVDAGVLARTGDGQYRRADYIGPVDRGML